MKKIILYTILICFSLSAFSQKVKVKSIRKLAIEEKAWFPDFGNNSREILLSGQHYKGLSIYDSKKKELKVLSESNRAGSEIEKDNSGNIVFKETIILDGKKSVEYFIYNHQSKAKNSINKNQVPQTLKAKVKSKEIQILQGDNLINSFAPLDDKFYVWSSISPDGEKLLFTAVGDATYISDLNGSILSKLGYLNAPEWINNEWVVGMDDKDDGEILLSSDIIAVHIDTGRRFNLTKKFNAIAQYPKVSPERKKLIFHTPEGEVFIMRIKTK